MATSAQEGAALDGLPQLGAQDYANILVGFMCFYGTFMVGKIAIDSIEAARRERFENKGQPNAAVKAKESTADGIVKVLAIGYGMYQLSEQLPVLLKEAQGLLK